jgi:hypothetical protein
MRGCAHEFFEGIDFERVLRRVYKPPFTPEVATVGRQGCPNFDSEITAEPSVDSFVSALSESYDDLFFGFSFKGDLRMSEGSDEEMLHGEPSILQPYDDCEEPMSGNEYGNKLSEMMNCGVYRKIRDMSGFQELGHFHAACG